jgi:hypothetical protein
VFVWCGCPGKYRCRVKRMEAEAGKEHRMNSAARSGYL